jgi:3-hydroxyacyl-CoA dehydrogenase
MTLDERLQDVTVLGAGGKMGSGISLLLAQEMTLQKLTNENKNYVLNLIDVNSDALTGLQD